MKNKWGFLRETSEQARKAGIDKDTGIHRTGLDEYLKIIFPNTDDWIHDKMIGKVDGVLYRSRPDYRSESLKLIIEFDGLPHYQKPDIIQKDERNTKMYESLGYKVIRIPYFIQFTNKAVKELFDIEIKEQLFDETISSMGVEGKNTPAFLCPAGIQRMAMEFKRFPEQYETNLKFMQSQNDEYQTGTEYFINEYKKAPNKTYKQ
ncbi:MAG: DUF559 domain-containing protein [Ekhidna sp.]|nr:DUF559 domain-containing protein [Ekhidna sp.]